MPEEKSPLLEQEEITPVPDYTPEQEKYLTGLHKRLVRARDARDQARVEFDGMTYTQYCESNRKLANSYIKPRQNREDTNYQSGTIRQKMMAVLAAINNLDLFPDINVFDKDDISLAQFGNAIEDIIWKTEEMENDEEKKLLRQYTLMEQGTTFVNEDWIEKSGVKKEITQPFDGSTADWNYRVEKVFDGASRNIIQNEKVYLGDITQFAMDDQPYVYTVEVMPYDVAEQIYGEWEMWKFVTKERKRFLPSDESDNTLYNSNFVLTQIQDEQVEVIKYQDKPNNEFQIIINSIPMLPIGFPMPWKHDKYSLVKQVFSVISPDFAYGKSFPSVTRLQVAVWDEMLRLMVLKTQKSFKPPMANLTGKVLSSRIFMPGVIADGIDPEEIRLLDPDGSNGMTNAEANALNVIKGNIDQLTVDPTFTGQQPQGSPTATQIIEVQRQARLVLGLAIFVASMLEKKLAEIRIANILDNWFDPTDTVIDEVRGELQKRFRSFSRQAPIEGRGLGQRVIRVVEEPKRPFELFKEEERIEEREGIPTRIVELQPDVIKSTKFQMYVTVIPREKRTSPTSKLMFREMMADLMAFDRPDRGIAVDWSHAADRFATNWEENPEKLFKKVDQQEQMQQQQQQEQGSQGTQVATPPQNQTQRPRVNLNVGLPQ